MSFLLKNESLPLSTDIKKGVNAPLYKLNSAVDVQSINSSATLLKVNYFNKYDGVTFTETELNNPDYVYNLYKLTLPFVTVLSARIENYILAENFNKLTNMRFITVDNILYLMSVNIPENIKINTEIIAPIPNVVCELIINIPANFSVDNVIHEGSMLNFVQDNQTLIIDCDSSCCRLRGGERLQAKGSYSGTPELICTVYNFRINQKLGLIEYVDWRGSHFLGQQQNEIKKGLFLWDEVINSLNLLM